jgi:hypothetical protein
MASSDDILLAFLDTIAQAADKLSNDIRQSILNQTVCQPNSATLAHDEAPIVSPKTNVEDCPVSLSPSKAYLLNKDLESQFDDLLLERYRDNIDCGFKLSFVYKKNERLYPNFGIRMKVHTYRSPTLDIIFGMPRVSACEICLRVRNSNFEPIMLNTVGFSFADGETSKLIDSTIAVLPLNLEKVKQNESQNLIAFYVNPTTNEMIKGTKVSFPICFITSGRFRLIEFFRPRNMIDGSDAISLD